MSSNKVGLGQYFCKLRRIGSGRNFILEICFCLPENLSAYSDQDMSMLVGPGGKFDGSGRVGSGRVGSQRMDISGLSAY